MATPLAPARPRPTPPVVQVQTAEVPVDVRAFARQFVATLLALEGVSITPTAIAEAAD